MKLNSQLVSLSILLCILAFGLSAFAQAKKEITENEYWQAMRAANDAEDKLPYRSISIEETYENGKVIGTNKGISEQTSADTTRYILQENYKGKSATRETIKIGEYYYCRENSYPWTKSTGFCGMLSSRGLPPGSVVHFTVDETKINGQAVKLYVQSSAYKDSAGTERFFEDKTWINSSGRRVRVENVSGLGNGKDILSKEIITYEYNPKDLKIVAPIK